MNDLPKQIEKFFELQHFDLDISANLIESPKETVISLTSSIAESSPNNDRDLFERSTVADQDTMRGTTISDNGSIMTLTEANLNRQQEQLRASQTSKTTSVVQHDEKSFRSKVQQRFAATLYINKLVGDQSEVSFD